MSCPGLWGAERGEGIAQAVGASAEMELRVARSGGVRGRAGCEGCGVSHSPAQILWNEGRRMGPARPGGTRHQDSRQGGSPVEGGEAGFCVRSWRGVTGEIWPGTSQCVCLCGAWGPESPSGCFPTPAPRLLLPLPPLLRPFFPTCMTMGGGEVSLVLSQPPGSCHIRQTD